MKIAIGSDHRGYRLKEKIKSELNDVQFIDCGCESEESTDYPDYGEKVSEKVSSGEIERGILICGSGIGMSIVANKFRGVRAALCISESIATLSREHNDSNILVIGANQTSSNDAVNIVRSWISGNFEGGRHEKRLKKINEIEKRNMRGGDND